MKVLTFTTLYPDSTRPRHGIFIENRIRQLVATGKVSVRVVAPCPWFPFEGIGSYAEFARVPRFEVRHGIPVHHPRYPVIPKIGMNAAPILMALALRNFMRRLAAEEGGFDLIDAHYFYPDGVAAVMLAAYVRRPVTITGRGSDLNILPLYRVPRAMIGWAARRAEGLSTVSSALRERLVALGIPRERVKVLRNGVDLDLFRPLDRALCRARAGFAERTLLSVGNLVPIKAHETTIEALVALPGTRLAIVGEGPERTRLEGLAQRLGVSERVAFLGNRPQTSLPELYNAADSLVLASRHEGWPNVLLEAIACGTPVVVSDIAGMDEIVSSSSVGRTFRCDDSGDLARAVTELRRAPPAVEELRAHAEKFSWRETTDGQIALFSEILAAAGARAGRSP